MTDTPQVPSEPLKPEFSRSLEIRQVEGKSVHVDANAAERQALAQRFSLVRIDLLTADLELERKDRKVEARGRIKAEYVQSCAVSAEDIAVSLDEPLFFRFVPKTAEHAPDEELELDSDDCDEVEYTGTMVDVGEAVAQSLALSIDPFLTGPEADAARLAAGIGTPEDNSPFSALKGLGLKK